MQDFRNLKVWQKAHAFVMNIYRLSGAFPNHETFGLRSQIRRAAIMIPTHIAEGCGRPTDPEFKRLALMSFSSSCEIEYFLLLAHDLTYITDEDYARLNDDVIELKRMLSGLLATLAG